MRRRQITEAVIESREPRPDRRWRRGFGIRRLGHRLVGISAIGLGCVLAVGAAPAAADTSPPTATASFAAAPDGNGGWRITKPQTLQLAATDDVAVSNLQYSLDGGLTYADAPISSGASVSANVPLTLEGNTALRYRAIDSSGNVSRGASANTTLNQAAAAGATGIRLQSTAGRSAGDELVIGTGANQETATIDTIVTPAPPSPGANVTLRAPLANAHAAGTAVAATSFFGTITLQLDTQGPVATWGTQATTLQATSSGAGAPAAVPGDTGVRLASTAGRAVGDVLVLDQAGNAETVRIASVVSPAPPAPAPNVTLSAPVQKLHLAGSAVYVPSIVDGKVMQSQTLTPLRTDPRRRDASDTVANGAGGSAIRRMIVDGERVIPFPLALNNLTVGRHTQSVALQDVAGSVAKYTNTFVVTTSFDDLAVVIDQYAGNALRTTLNGASAAGATALRLQTPFGFRAGQEIVIDSGDNQETATIAKALSPPPTLNTTLSAAASAGATEVRLASYTTSDSGGPNAPSNNGPIAGQPIVLDTGANLEVVTVERHITPVPAAPAPNVVLSAPLAKDHAAGTPTNLSNVILSEPLQKAHAGGAAVINPRPRISADLAAELKGLLAQAEAAADAGNKGRAVSTLNRFKAAVLGGLTPANAKRTERAALSSAANALIDQVDGVPVDTSGTGVEVGPADDGDQAIRAFWNPSPLMADPGADYKVLVNGRAGGFRHQSIVDFEALIQELGLENNFDVDVWDPNIGATPGRQAPAGVSLTASPFMDLETLKQYKTIVFNSTVGRGGQALNAIEFANLQQYVREGGGVVALHGATDSMQNVPWYMDLVGAGFTNHGGNAGGILIDTESGGHVELTNADPSHFTTSAVPDRFVTVEEVYNLNRDPVEMGIVHPLMYENEDSLLGQIGYSTGSLMNTDRHAMTWCRNFEGGRSFTTTLGHSWQFALEPWWQEMLLGAIEWTAGLEYANCVSFREVSDLIEAAAAVGDLDADGEARLDRLLSDGRAQFDGSDYGAAASTFRKLVNAVGKEATGASRDELAAKGEELVAWAKGLR
jgi:type 1 glutamine amidotransferase